MNGYPVLVHGVGGADWVGVPDVVADGHHGSVPATDWGIPPGPGIGRIFSYEFDGKRRKRVLVKIIGE